MQESEIKYASICQTGTAVLKNGKETKLHPYQQQAKSNIFSAWDEVRHVMLQMPTGTGKTYLFSSLINDINKWSQDTHTPNKMLVIAHRKELIDQIDKSLEVFGVRHSVLAGPKEQRNLSNPVIVSSIQTITHPANQGDVERLRERIHFIIIDEAHHSMADSYRKLWKMFPNARFLGVTATPWRMNHSGFRKIFDTLILTQPVKKFIQQGYLSPYNYYSLKPESHVQDAIDGIKKFDKWGDYDEHTLIDTMDHDHIRAQLVNSYKKLAWGKKGIIYSISKQHSLNICEDFRKLGVRIVDIDDKTPTTLRKQYVDDFKAGKIDIIVNVNIFSEGFDCPDIEFIQLARPTRSLTMYIQQVGRGLRKAEGKSKCIILDNVGMYSRFGLPDANRHWMAHFNGKDVDESPKCNGGRLLSELVYEQRDLNEGDEDMLLIQQADSYDFNDIDAPAEDRSIDDEKKPSQTKEKSEDVVVVGDKKENTPKTVEQEGTAEKKLKRVPAMHPACSLHSRTFADGKYMIEADNGFYYIKSVASGNSYFIAPVMRKPSENDELIVREDAGIFVVEHIIPDAEKATLRTIGELSIEENGIVTFCQYFGERKITSEFEAL